MQFLVTLLLVVTVHLAHAVAAWTQIGLLADDRHMVGAAVLRHRGAWSFGSMFAPDVAPGADAATALYRPFVDLVFWFEQPWFGAEATGYHVVNSAMHCGTAMLWFVLVRRLSGSFAAALACALLFVGWPSHGEATHWIAARTNVQSTFLLSTALLLLDVGLCRGRGAARGILFAAAAVVATIAVGTKESAVFVLPLAACLAWLRSDGAGVVARVRAALPPVLPMALLLGGWLAWRAHVLGTWGSGTHYGWHAARLGWQVCGDWLELLLAPRHRGYTANAWGVVQWLLHGGLLLAAVFALRTAAARGAALLGGVLLVMGFLAGIGLEHMDPSTLENARYSYEPVLGLCVLGGLGIAVLPARARALALGVLVLVHGFAFDGNRRSWLCAGAVYQRMEHDIGEVARSSQQPIRVLQAPGVYEGAFAFLNGFTEFQFMQAFAPAGTNLRGKVSSTQEWRETLHELAAAAAAKQPPENAFTVRWDDGGLEPFALDPQWPAEPRAGLRLAFAWVARQRPFVGTAVPVQVLLRTDANLELLVDARTMGRGWTSAAVPVAAGTDPQAVELELPIPDDVGVGERIVVSLRVKSPAGGYRIGLGTTVPSARVH